MATVTMDKSCRMDMRMSEHQRALFEKAAAIKGQTLTQWSLAHLESDAEQDILESSTLLLSSDNFDSFANALEAPMPRALKQLLNTEDAWA